MRYFRLLALIAIFLLTACSSMGISNPFDSTSDVNEVYFDQFPDVAIPYAMSVDQERTLITTAPDNTKSGLLTVTGRVERTSLSNAMVHNMNKQGWTLRGMTSGDKTIHIYEKNQRYAVIYFYEQLTKSAMEIWIANRLNENAALNGSNNSGSMDTPSFYLTPTESTAGGSNVRQEGLKK